jgi:hypothetical protein
MRGRGNQNAMDDRDGERPDWNAGPMHGGPMHGGPGGPQAMGPGGRFGGPPQEMFDACAGKKAGDDCSVKKDDWELKAKCNVPPRMGAEGRLACTPPHQPPGAAPAAAEPAKLPAPAAKPKK